jgi:hypothetical protein
VEYGEAEFTVEKADRHRIRSVKLIMKNPVVPESADAAVGLS